MIGDRVIPSPSTLLTASAVPALPAPVRPLRTHTADRPGIVHIGLGAFHRAHQAVYTEMSMAAESDDSWQILGVSPRSREIVQTIRAQDGYYTVLEREGDRSAPRVIGSLVDSAHLPTEPERVLDAIAAETTRIVTLTVTEKGYGVEPGSRSLLVNDEIRADAAGGPPRTVVGLLVRGLQRRADTGAGPIAVACCDNLTANGELLAGLVREFCALLPEPDARAVLDFVDEAVRFPCSVVDRIVPATTERDLTDVEAAIGHRDRAAVRAEPFTQWVMTDDFPAGRPRWERSGAVFTEDTGPYERAKLRVLNGTHSALAYLGGLAGYGTIAETIRDERFAGFAQEFITREVLPTLVPPPGVDLSEYAATVLRRFANPALGHRTAQVASDGSQKIPVRLTGIIRHHRESGSVAGLTALVVAAWWRYTVVGESDAGEQVPVHDPLAETLRRRPDPRAALELVAPELADDVDFVAEVREYQHQLASVGVLGLLAGERKGAS